MVHILKQIGSCHFIPFSILLKYKINFIYTTYFTLLHRKIITNK